MRTYLFIFALVLISSASAFKTRRTMGTVLTQIRAMMDSKGPQQDVLNLIDGLAAEVRDEQVQHDELRVKQQQQCEQEINYRNGAIADGEAALEASEAHRDKCVASRANDETNIDINLQNQQDTKDTLVRIAQKRQEEAAQYGRRSVQHKESHDIIDEAEDYLDQLVTGQASLAQIGQNAAKLIKKGVEMRKISSFAPAVQAFAQLAIKDDASTYYDGDAVERVRAIFNQVRDELNVAFAAYTKVEQEAIDLYLATKAQLESHLEDLEADEKTLRDHHDEMTSCINQENAIQESAQHKIERNTGLLNDATSLCANQEEQYERATEARTEEVKVLGELRGIVEKRYAQFSAGAAHRADADSFEAYENKSQYEREDYTKNGGDFNAGGAQSAGYERDQELERFL